MNISDIKTLYKYRYFDRDGYHIKTIQNNEFYFASKIQLNDPFDFSLRPLYEKATPTQLKGYINQLRRNYIDKGILLNFKTINDGKKRINELLKKVDHNYKMVQNELNKNLEYIINNYEICSFTVNNWYDVLMWSHYSDSHRGFCVGIDFIKLRNYILNQKKYNQIDVLTPVHFIVNYVEEYPEINPFEREKFRIIFTTKYIKWNYENEVRLIREKTLNHTLILPDEFIDEIIVGLHCDADNINIIKNILINKPTKIKLFKIVQKPQSFKFDKEEIIY
ncbi:MAG: DUF2971 domain-containing protein [Ignavibacteriae bacterium]|nr:DUF2971 domain-containing protein [Ignavibacteriota bacterium]